MDSGLKPYERMKDSGLEWLGEVPEHWEVLNLGQIGTFSKGRGGSKEDERQSGIPCIRYGDLYTTHQHFIHASRSYIARKRSSHYTSIKYGDVLFAASGETSEEIGKSAVNLIRSEVRCGGDIILFRPNREFSPKFLGYATDCRSAIIQKALMGRGFTVVHIYTSQLKRLCLALPPLSEQIAIASFLDYAISQTERYIRAKEKLIALLEEQKQVIIHDAVTGRIDVRTGKPYPAYKPSGVDWLREVPVHWNLVRNGRLFIQRNEAGFSELPILEVSLRSGVRVRNFENSSRKQVMSDRDKYKRAVKGDIAYNMMRMWQGAVGVAPVDGLVSPAYVVARPLAGTESRYFDHLFHTNEYMIEVDQYSRGIVKDRNRLYWEDFKQMPSPYPPPNEQVVIANTIDHIGQSANAKIRNLQQQIALANEYRTRLIADVVTGKLDAGEAAKALPDVDSTMTTADAMRTESNTSSAKFDSAESTNPRQAGT